MLPRTVIFDLDETLAESKQPMSPNMAELFTQLLARTNAAIISGQKHELVLRHTHETLPAHADRSNLYLLPTCGASLHAHEDGSWRTIYEELLSLEEAALIKTAIEEAIEETGLIDLSIDSYGERIEHRGSSVALSALGQTAPLPEKLAWDPERVKRPVLREAIARRLSNFDVRTGGSTSFDVTKPGLNKAYGVRMLSEHLSIPITDMLYIGDALFPGGNDEVVKETGIETRQTSGPEETARIIRELLAT